MISRAEVLMGRDLEYPLDDRQEENLEKLLEALNVVRETYGKPMVVSSGYRPGRYNQAAGGAKRSAHLTCEACDFRDVDGRLEAWLSEDVQQDLLEALGLWQEEPNKTLGWVHLDIRQRAMVDRAGLKKRQFKA